MEGDISLSRPLKEGGTVSMATHGLESDWLSVVACMLAAAVLLLLGIVRYYDAERYVSRMAVILEAADLTLAMGRGERTDDGLRIDGISAAGFASISGPPIKLDARRYTELAWRIDGLEPGTVLRLIWSTDDAPRSIRETTVAHSGDGDGRFDLRGLAGWQGTVVNVGLVVPGRLPGPVTVRRLAFGPQRPDSAALLGQIWGEWTRFSDWKGSSINVVRGAVTKPLLPPLPTVAAWVGLSAVLYGLICLVRRRIPGRVALIVMFLMGWLMLDLQWQGALWHTLHEARVQYAGQSYEDRQRAGPDGDLYRLIAQVRQALPAQPARLLLLAPQQGIATRYLGYRSRYHLLPHNVLLLLDPGPLGSRIAALHPGDWLLLPKDTPGLDFRDGTLSWNSGKAAARRVLRTPLYDLYQLQ